MPIRPQIAQLRFDGSLETKADDKVVGLDRLLKLQNAVFDRAGIAQKRNGYEDLGLLALAGSTISGARKLARRDDELLLFTSDRLYSYVDELGRWRDAGAVVGTSVAAEVVAKTATNQTLADLAELGGIAVYVWEDSAGGVWYSIGHVASGAVIKAPAQLDADGSRPRVVAAGANLVIVFAEPAANRLWTKVISTAAPLTDNAVEILVDDLDSSGAYDVHGDGTKIALAYDAVTADVLKVGYIHSSGEIGRPTNGLASPMSLAATGINRGPAIAIDSAGAGNLGVVWGSAATKASYAVLDSDLATVVAPRTLAAGAAEEPERMTLAWEDDADASGDRVARVLWDRPGATARDDFIEHTSFTTAPSEGSVARQRGLSLASRAFVDDGEVFVHAVRDSTYFAAQFCLRASDALVVARFHAGVSGGQATKRHLPGVSSSGRVHTVAAIYYEVIPESASSEAVREAPDLPIFGESGIRRVAIDFDDGDSLEGAQLGASLYLGGGLLQEYDGHRVAEAEFHWAPDDVAAPVQSAPAGDGVDVGAHLYVFVFEVVTDRGEIKRGPVSVAVTVVVSSSAKKVTFDIPTLTLTGWDGVRIGVFRSAAGVETALYRVSSLDPSATGVNGYVENDTSVDSVSFSDELSDANLISQEPLYTNGGVLANKPIPPTGVITSGKTRLFASDATDPDVVRFSQELAEGYTVELTSLANRLRIPALGGAVTALAEMDESLIVFKERAIYAVGGSGPLPNAAGGFQPPQLITTDAGCSAARSVAMTPHGLVFQSGKGIHLLGRDGQVSYLGAAVEGFTDPTRGNQTVVAAVLAEDRRQIRFLCSTGESLLFDYERGKWSSWTNHTGKDAVQIGTKHHYIRDDGAVWRETPGVYKDGAQQIRMTLGTAWVRFANQVTSLQEIWRVALVGNFRSLHTLRVRGFYDYEAGHDDEWLFDPSEFIAQPLYGEGQYGQGQFGDGDEVEQRYELQFHVGQKCRAFRLEIADIEDTGVAGAAYELVGGIVEGGVHHRGAVVAEERMS